MVTHPTRAHLRILPVTRTGWSSVAMAAFLGLALAGAVAGIMDLVRSRPRALVLVLPILYGLAWAAFLAGESTNPH